MSSDDGQSSYYVRVRGKVLGPYTIKQLTMLRTRGQISQSNEVSTDGSTWESAAHLREVFETAPRSSGRERSDGTGFDLAKRQPEATPESPKGQWYYSLDGAQLGPVPKTDVIQMLGVGALKPEDLVWTEGMTEWQPVADTVDFANLLPQASRGSGNSRAANESGSGEMPGHFLDYLLGGLRNGLNESSIQTMEAIPIEIGRWAMYFSMLLALILSFYMGFKHKAPLTSLVGFGYAFIILASQFAAVKILGAINLTLRAKPQRMSSTAFLDSGAVLFAVHGLMFLIGAAYYSVQFKQHIPLLIAIAVFIAFLQIAFVLLNPHALAITINSRTSAAEEALAVLTFICMLPVRFAISLFAAGTTIGVVGTIVMFSLALSSKDTELDFLQNMGLAMDFLGVVQSSALITIIAYVYYIMVSLIIGLMQAILVIPDKLDDLRENPARKLAADVVSGIS